MLVVAGGVAANKYIFHSLLTRSKKRLSSVHAAGQPLYHNAAMIAWAALERRHHDATDSDDFDFAPRPRWPLDGQASPPPGRGVRA